jgi:glycosyltransferase involved in cell wall biosynthesis
VPPTGSAPRAIRIARVITRLNVGGPAIQAIELSARLESPHCHTLLVHGRLGRDEGDMRYLVPDDRGFDMTYVPSLRRDVNPLADLAAVRHLFALLRRFEPTIVHTHMAKAGTVGRAAALLYNATVGRSRRARLVHTYHGHVLDGYFSPIAAGAFTAVERALARRTDALIAVSDLVGRDLVDSYHIGSVDRFHVVPLGFDLSRLAALGPSDCAAARAALGMDPDAHIVALVGRLTAIKRPDVFVEAAARVAAADPRARFLIAGGGELESDVRADIAARRLGDRIRMLGWQRDIAIVFAASDLIAITSRNEGTPVALIEGMAAGVPGVCFAVGGVPDVISAPDLGALVGEGDVDGLAAAMRRLLDDNPLRAAMGARARVTVVTRFSIERLVGDVTALYRQLVG